MATTSLTFAQLLTLTRASTKTVPNASGILTAVTAGNPAFEYDPTSLALNGFSVEGPATNLVFPSADANALFNNLVQMTIPSTNMAVAPDGTTTAKKATVNTTSGGHYINSIQSGIAANQPLVLDLFLKAAEFTTVAFDVLAQPTSTNAINCNVNLTAGTISTTLAGTATGAGTIKAYPNGWYRCTIIGQPSTSSTDTGIAFRCIPSPQSTSDGTSGFYVWGGSVQAGASVKTSFIPTTTAAATRAADACQFVQSEMSQWFVANSGTLYVQARLPQAAPTGSDQVLWRMDDGTSNNYMEIVNPGGTSNVSCTVVSGGTVVFTGAGGTLTPGTAFIAALSFVANNFQFSVNGAAAITASTGALPVGINAGWLGSRDGTAAFANGELQDVAFYTPAVLGTDLQTLTA